MRIQLSNRAILRISGADAESFLQAQLSNDINLLSDESIQLSAFCQHQGKIIALFWLMRSKGNYLLSFPADLLETVIKRLQMFVIMSDVLIENISDQVLQIGLINENHSEAYSINDNLLLLIEYNQEKNIEFNSHYDHWAMACINSQIPEVFLNTSEKLVPQMLNLDINEVGVNFSKGCYPGQEVVARLHYLGEAKRRLFSFKSNGEIELGDNLYCASSKAAKARGSRYKVSGIVVNRVKYKSIFYCLATLDVELLEGKITINNEHGSELNLLKK